MVTALLKVNESEKKEGKLKSTIALCRIAANLKVKEMPSSYKPFKSGKRVFTNFPFGIFIFQALYGSSKYSSKSK